MAVEDREELKALRARDGEACESFVDAHYRGVYRFFLWLTNRADAADDLTQESFAAFWESLDRLDPAAAPEPKSWLYAIARNRWRKRCRDARGTEPLEAAEGIADRRPSPEERLLESEKAGRITRAVAELPADHREALVLRVFEELSYRDIGIVLGISAELARWRVHNARRRLRERLCTESDGATRAG